MVIFSNCGGFANGTGIFAGIVDVDGAGKADRRPVFTGRRARHAVEWLGLSRRCAGRRCRGGAAAPRALQLAPVGRVDAELANPEALSKPVGITGSWNAWTVSPAAITLPAERLAALGAPLNTLQPSGRMTLSWQPLQIARQGQQAAMTGTMQLLLEDIASRLSPIRPLGAYKVSLDWRGQQAQMQLTSTRGPLLLTGSGRLDHGRMQFSGRAQAEAGQEQRLANLLNLLGQRRSEGGKDYISLEFK